MYVVLIYLIDIEQALFNIYSSLVTDANKQTIVAVGWLLNDITVRDLGSLVPKLFAEFEFAILSIRTFMNHL